MGNKNEKKVDEAAATAAVNVQIPSGNPFSVEDKVDAYWPPDRYGKTKLQNVRWPGVISSVNMDQLTYKITYDDGETYDKVPFDFTFGRTECKDLKSDCSYRARNGDCKKKPTK